MQFTSEQALNDKRNKIKLTYTAAASILAEHTYTMKQFLNETGFKGETVPARILFEWMGY